MKKKFTQASNSPPNDSVGKKPIRKVIKEKIKKRKISENFDPTQLYLKDIGCHHLLSKEEEVELFKKIAKGDSSAIKKVVSCNLRLVVKIARQYHKRGIPFLDLLSEGNIGLIHAVDKYEYKRGFRFSTYATWWIKQNIERAIMEQTRNIRLPFNVIKKLNKCLITERKLMSEKEQQKISCDEIAESLNSPLKKIEKLMEHKYDTMSLDKIIFHDNSTKLYDFVPDEKTKNPLIELCEEDMHLIIEEWIDSLDKKTRTIICHRYGLRNYKPFTLAKLSKKLGFAREKIRQIQLRALERLKRQLKRKGILEKSNIKKINTDDDDN
jgi:RNA polymerase nonessential primary-like sigma factor